MAFDGTDKCWRPSNTPSADIEPRLQTSQFGDGYAQRVIDGINPDKTTWNLTFDGKRDDEINAMNQYLKDLKGAQFGFLDPFTRQVVQVFCDKWSIAVTLRKGDGSWIGQLTAAFYSANGAGLS